MYKTLYSKEMTILLSVLTLVTIFMSFFVIHNLYDTEPNIHFILIISIPIILIFLISINTIFSVQIIINEKELTKKYIIGKNEIIKWEDILDCKIVRFDENHYSNYIFTYKSNKKYKTIHLPPNKNINLKKIIKTYTNLRIEKINSIIFNKDLGSIQYNNIVKKLKCTNSLIPSYFNLELNNEGILLKDNSLIKWTDINKITFIYLN